MKKVIIAIDGFSACGKSSTAKSLADKLGYTYIDTGAMYRAVTLYFLNNYVDITNPRLVDKALDQIELDFRINPKTKNNEIYLSGLNVEEHIRDMRISQNVSEVSKLEKVRSEMVGKQVKLGKYGGVVMDGRDIGTAVFPNAEVKIFMTADFDVRAARRQTELLEKGELVNLEEVKQNLRLRDELDSTREISPLRKAVGAKVVDTTHITPDEQVEIILNYVNKARVRVF